MHRPSRTRPSSVRSPATLIVVESLVAAALLAWVWLPSPAGAVGATIAGVVATVVLIGTMRSAAAVFTPAPTTRLRYAVSRTRRPRRPDVAAARNIPSLHRTPSVPGDGADIGARRSGGRVITALEVCTRAPAFAVLGGRPRTHSGAPAYDPSHVADGLPLGAMAECLEQFDIELESITVVAAVARTWGTDRIARGYADTLGPLPATAYRRVHVLVCLDPARCPDAVTRRGGGDAGALRTAAVATRRLAARLTENGFRATSLSSDQISEIDLAATHGYRLDDAVERIDSVDMGASPVTSWAIDPTSAAGFAETLTREWHHQGAPTTLTLRMTRDTTGLALCGLVRRRPDGAAPTPPAGLVALPGHQWDALLVGLPVAARGDVDRRLPALRGPEARRVAAVLRLVTAPDGQVVGADAAGCAVAIPLLAPTTRTVTVNAELPAVFQVVLRALASGAAITVVTDRPDRWHPLVSAVADPHRLSFAPGHRHAAHAIRAVIDDRHEYDDLVTPPPGGTLIRVIRPSDSPNPATTRPAVTGDREVMIRQLAGGGRVEVLTRTSRIELTMVATPAEWALVGGPLGV